MSKFYQRYVTGTKKASEEEKLLSKAPSNVVRQVDPTAMAPSHITKRPITTSSTTVNKTSSSAAPEVSNYLT